MRVFVVARVQAQPLVTYPAEKVSGQTALHNSFGRRSQAELDNARGALVRALRSQRAEGLDTILLRADANAQARAEALAAGQQFP